MINDLERSCDDGIACIQHLCRRPHFVPGAGATEMQLATALREEANKTDSLDQYSIRKVGSHSLFLLVQEVKSVVNPGPHSSQLVANFICARAQHYFMFVAVRGGA